MEEDMKKDNLKQQLLKCAENQASGCSNGDEGRITTVLAFSIFVAICGSFTAGCTKGYSSPIQSQIISDIGLSTADYSLFGSMLAIGGLLGSFMCGKITDYLGRRGAMGLSDILFLFGWLAIALSKGAWSLVLGRLLLGFSNSIVVYTVPIYIAEITPKNLRGGSVLIFQLMLSSGITLMYTVGLIIRWRILALIGIIPCIIQLCGLWFIPESPRWLVKFGHVKSFEAALQRLRGENVDISQEAADIKGYIEAPENKEAEFFSVFSRKYTFALTVGLGVMALSGLAGTSGVLYYATSIFQSAGFSVSIGTVLMAVLQLPPLFLGVFLMDKYGRRPLLMFSAGGLVAACLSLALSFFLKEHGWFIDHSPYLAFIGIMIFSLSFPLGFGGIPFIIMSEIFPMDVKWAAGSLAIVVKHMCDFIVSYSFNFMMNWSSSGTFFIFTSINMFSVLFATKFVPETKGRSLEELQESLNPHLASKTNV
ncbi:unnamed protein product [Amaranthus hypochondriacus]